ncbi:cupin domain-containing protein [Mucilaginibacter ginsenosidivorans]|uniref:Cupin domain-containing protein n=1 Tax=Mucilaginibacter ginsenosidivorans TaxID=398053 RepID=A0A5B8UZP1_9SPHI|nr:cupin domain-containing protein [Mucilaginibacter ginsenosidivorans]QEC64687.1 cupin domain-containing protein [Mucilaginibacter ginsenosidivorans]
MQISVNDALNQLGNDKVELFKKVLEHGTMSVELYRPLITDTQSPHTQDELYVIIKGTGEFVNGNKRTDFNPGDVLFVAAGTEHRFENFSSDFLTWVIFYGPDGGEK